MMATIQRALSGALVLALTFLIARAEAQSASATRYPLTLATGPWRSGHVQGIAVDRARGYVYYSFTTLLVKTDLNGRVIGTLGGWHGHLGDIHFNDQDRHVYGSLEYKPQRAWYVAVIDGDRINRMEMQAQKSPMFETVYMKEVVDDFSADMNGDGIVDMDDGTFSADPAKSPDHRYGCSGIDGTTFGPRFGQTGGKRYLTVAYGIYGNVDRTDNDHQVFLQYDVADWAAKYAHPLDEAALHYNDGPPAPDGKYFVYTGNTTYGVQNIEYDDYDRLWMVGVYQGKKPSFPNYTFFAVSATAQPVMSPLKGTSDHGLLLPLDDDGLRDPTTGIRGWFQKADVGMSALGDGLFYLAVNGKTSGGMQTAQLTLYRWTGGTAATPFRKIAAAP